MYAYTSSMLLRATVRAMSSSALETVRLTPDGGVVKAILARGSGPLPVAGECAARDRVPAQQSAGTHNHPAASGASPLLIRRLAAALPLRWHARQRNGFRQQPRQESALCFQRRHRAGYQGRVLGTMRHDRSNHQPSRIIITLLPPSFFFPHALSGWDIGMSSMQVGERAILTCTGPYAYGPAGAGGVSFGLLSAALRGELATPPCLHLLHLLLPAR